MDRRINKEDRYIVLDDRLSRPRLRPGHDPKCKPTQEETKKVAEYIYKNSSEAFLESLEGMIKELRRSEEQARYQSACADAQAMRDSKEKKY